MLINTKGKREGDNSPLPTDKNCGKIKENVIEVAEAKKLREPAGRERSGGKSAESTVQAWAADGDGGNTAVTVYEVCGLHSCAI